MPTKPAGSISRMRSRLAARHGRGGDHDPGRADRDRQLAEPATRRSSRPVDQSSSSPSPERSGRRRRRGDGNRDRDRRRARSRSPDCGCPSCSGWGGPCQRPTIVLAPPCWGGCGSYNGYCGGLPLGGCGPSACLAVGGPLGGLGGYGALGPGALAPGGYGALGGCGPGGSGASCGSYDPLTASRFQRAVDRGAALAGLEFAAEQPYLR
jgi:hypothetical protein